MHPTTRIRRWAVSGPTTRAVIRRPSTVRPIRTVRAAAGDAARTHVSAQARPTGHARERIKFPTERGLAPRPRPPPRPSAAPARPRAGPALAGVLRRPTD